MPLPFLKKFIPLRNSFFYLLYYLLSSRSLRHGPGSFMASFLYIGTFIALADQPKRQWLLALIANQLLLALIWKLAFNPIATVMSLPLYLLTSWLVPLGYGYLFTFKWLSINWIEPMVHLYISLIKFSAKLAHSFATAPSLMFLLLIWMILWKAKPMWIALVMMLCGSLAVAPTISY